MEEGKDTKKQATREEERNAFEQERKVLLDRMAVQLKGVVQQMDRVNHNIEAMDTKPVNDVAKLWKESYAMSANKKSGEKEDPNSLLAFQNGL